MYISIYSFWRKFKHILKTENIIMGAKVEIFFYMGKILRHFLNFRTNV